MGTKFFYYMKYVESRGVVGIRFWMTKVGESSECIELKIFFDASTLELDRLLTRVLKVSAW